MPGNTAQGRHYSPAGQASTSRGRESSGENEQAFTGGGLLGNTQHGYGSLSSGSRDASRSAHGAGIRNMSSGTQGQGGLIDLSETSRYAPGSLLAKVEREEGVAGPIIDRDA